jgi:hypothetical protein
MAGGLCPGGALFFFGVFLRGPLIFFFGFARLAFLARESAPGCF